MRFKTAAASLLLLLSFLSSFLPVSAQSSEDEKDLALWVRLVDEKVKEFEAMKDSVDLYAATVNKLADNFKAEVFRDEIRFHQISYLLTVNENNSYRFRLACSEMASQTSHFTRELRRIQEISEDLKRFFRIVEKAKTELRSLQEFNLGEESKEGTEKSLAMMERFQGRLNAMQANVDAALELGLKQLAKRQERQAAMDDEILENLKQNILSSRERIYDQDILPFLVVSAVRWTRNFSHSMVDKVPSSGGECLAFFICFLLTSAPAYLLLRWLLKRRIEASFARKEMAGLLLKRSLIWGSLALGFFFGGMFALSMPGNILVYSFGTIAVAAWAIDLGWALKLLNSEATRASSPLRLFFFVYIIGMGTQMSDMPPVLLSVAWPPVLLVLSCWHWRLAGKGGEGLERRQRRLMRFSSCMLAVFAVMAFIGYANLSVLATMFLFTFSVGFQFASSISAAMRLYVEQRKALGELLRSLTIGFVIPASWLLMLTVSTLWMANQVVDYKTCFDLFTDEYKFNGFSIRPVSMVLAVFLFFVVKTALGVICSEMDRESAKAGETPGYMSPFKTLISFLLWIGYALLILNFFGISISNLGVILGGLSVGIGFGLQNFISNMVSGLMLLFGKDIREGDIIQVGDTWAKVQKISLRSTMAYSTDNAVISIPNSILLSSQVVNWTLNNRNIRRDIKLPVAFGSDLDAAKDILVKIASGNPGVMKIPPPEAFISAIGSAANEMTLRVWVIDIEKTHQVLSELNRQIEGVFGGSSSQVAFPGMASALASSKEQAAKKDD